MRFAVCSAWSKDNGNGTVNVSSNMREVFASSVDEAKGIYIKDTMQSKEFLGHQLCHYPVAMQIPDAPQETAEESQANAQQPQAVNPSGNSEATAA